MKQSTRKVLENIHGAVLIACVIGFIACGAVGCTRTSKPDTETRNPFQLAADRFSTKYQGVEPPAVDTATIDGNVYVLWKDYNGGVGFARK